MGQKHLKNLWQHQGILIQKVFGTLQQKVIAKAEASEILEHMKDILMKLQKNLSSLAFYALHFDRIKPKDGSKSFPPPTTEVSVSLNLNGYVDPKIIKEMLKNRPVETKMGQYYQTLKLIF